MDDFQLFTMCCRLWDYTAFQLYYSYDCRYLRKKIDKEKKERNLY